MRWFVEVSRVGETSSDEKYCVEAKQWQAALQEARKLRGDSGPLSKFSIELLDDGYRAVDPKQKVRFVVAKAPPDAELSTESQVPRNGQPAPAPSMAPPGILSAPPAPVLASVPAPVASAPAPAPAPAPALAEIAIAPASVVASSPAVTLPTGVEPSKPPPAVSVAAPTPVTGSPVISAPPAPAAPAASSPAAKVQAEPYAGVPSSNLSPQAPASAAHSVPAAQPAVKAPSAFPPRPEAVRAPSAKPPAGITVPADAIPAAPALPKNLGPAVSMQQLTQPSPAIDMPPPSSVLRKRQEEPTTESPIAYREVAYVVEPGVTRGSVEALLWAAFRDISRELAGRTEQKFVQLAVFDHKFDKRPERAPLGTLAWKDWRGNPVLTFPLFDGTQPARASMPAPSIKPSPVVSISSSAPPPAPVSAAPAAPAAPPISAAPIAAPSVSPPPVVAPPPVVEAAPATVVAVPSAPPAPAAPVSAAPPAPAAPVSAAPAAPVSAPPVMDVPAPAAMLTPDPSAAIPLTREKMPSQPSSPRASRPRLAAVHRRAGEDLIGELFETMHDLHFMRDVAEGAEFTLAAVDSVLPSDGMLIHVFDINRGEFVVVRAKGPGSMQALLHRTPDTEPLFVSVMRRAGSVAFQDVAKDERVLGPRWDALGVKPQRVLCAPVRQGGRYLGLLEIANPLGDAPFHQTEQNAIDYVCEQFAEFLVNRPIVLAPDVILRR